MASIASSAFISSEIRRTISCRSSCGSMKNSTSSYWLSRSRIRWDRRRIFSRESFNGRFPRGAGASQDDALLARELLLHHLEHLGVGDVGALHLGGVLEQHLADLLVEPVLHH